MKIREAFIGFRETGENFELDDLTNAKAVVAYMKGALDFRPEQEQLWVIFADAQLRPMGRFLCTLGTVSHCVLHPREVFRAAVIGAASSVILVHNHPSGLVDPSPEDISITRRLARCGRLLEIPLVDHVIIGDARRDPQGRGFYSFSEEDPDLLEVDDTWLNQ